MALTPWLSHFKTDFELARRRRQESIAFDALRCEAFDRFLLLGCPTQADEHWRYIDITPIAETNFTLGAAPVPGGSRERIPPVPFKGTGDIEFTFVNGYFMPDGSRDDELPDAVLVAPLKSVLSSAGREAEAFFAEIARAECLPFVALNTALFEDGGCIIIPPRMTMDRPIHMRFICNGEADAKPAMSQPRTLIVLGDDAAATVTESYNGADVEYFTNAVTEVVLGKGARLRHFRAQRESEGAYHISAAHVIAGPHSTYAMQCTNDGGAVTRVETNVLLAGENARCRLTADTSAKNESLVNVHTTIDHAVANSVSRQRYKWTLADSASGVVTGRTTVRPDANNARVLHANRALRLSSGARIEVKPSFDILARDATLTQYSRVRQWDDTR
jgi:Fe-S cluster assembly protein SufD